LAYTTIPYVILSNIPIWEGINASFELHFKYVTIRLSKDLLCPYIETFVFVNHNYIFQIQTNVKQINDIILEFVVDAKMNETTVQ